MRVLMLTDHTAGVFALSYVSDIFTESRPRPWIFLAPPWILLHGQTLEPAIGIIASSLATLRPLLRKLLPNNIDWGTPANPLDTFGEEEGYRLDNASDRGLNK